MSLKYDTENFTVYYNDCDKRYLAKMVNVFEDKRQNIYLLCNKVLMESFENLIIVFTNINRHILSTNISCF